MTAPHVQKKYFFGRMTELNFYKYFMVNENVNLTLKTLKILSRILCNLVLFAQKDYFITSLCFIYTTILGTSLRQIFLLVGFLG